MSRTEAAVLQELLALTPPGAVLPVDGSGTWPQMLAPLAAEIARFESYADEMQGEVDPGTAQYLLPDYERVLGPDPYGRDATALDLAQQQALALSRWVTRYGVRPIDFINLAYSFGVVITIAEYQCTVVGDCIGAELVQDPTQFYWLVTINPGPSAGQVQDAIAGRAPAHTNPVFVIG